MNNAHAPDKIYVILGTTASGKTAYGVELAQRIGGEIINCDSMQVYKEIPTITAQPTLAEQQGVPHHLFGIISCLDKFDVQSWITLAERAILDVKSRGKIPILVGGTGMYVQALIDGIADVPEINQEIRMMLRQLSTSELYGQLSEFDQEAAEHLKPNDRQRVARALEVVLSTGKPLSYWHEKNKRQLFPKDTFHLIWLKRNRQEVYDRINQRFKEMVKLGALQEARMLIEYRARVPKAHGLPELIAFFSGDITLQEAVRIAQQNTRNYAKRQFTWFRHQMEFNEVIDI